MLRSKYLNKLEKIAGTVTLETFSKTALDLPGITFNFASSFPILPPSAQGLGHHVVLEYAHRHRRLSLLQVEPVLRKGPVGRDIRHADLYHVLVAVTREGEVRFATARAPGRVAAELHLGHHL